MVDLNGGFFSPAPKQRAPPPLGIAGDGIFALAGKL
jgi:hypothetical protein